jgi:hypothetical protein
MVGVEFITRRIAPLQDHRREIWRHRAGDDLRLHVSELNADAREEVIRAFFSSAAIPAIPRAALPIYNLGAREASRVMAGILRFNAWGPFLADGVMPGPLPSAPAASSERDSLARGAGPSASGDLDDDDDVGSGEWLARRRRPEGTVVLSDSSDDDSASPDQPTGGDADVSSSRDLEEEGHRARLEAERRSKFNDERASRRPDAEASRGKKPAEESSTPPPKPSSLLGKRGWVERDAS